MRNKCFFAFYLGICFLVLFLDSAKAASCCGAAFGPPALITNDGAAQVTIRGSSQTLSREVSATGLWRRPENPENVRSIRIEAATLISDRWQTGFVFPLTERKLNGRASTGVGDLSANLAYELITDWDYNPWRPRGLVYLRGVAPTGKPWPLATERSFLDARGRGFWAAGLGFLLTKAWGSFDAYASGEANRAFPRTFASPLFRGRLEPAWGINSGFGAGFSIAGLRFGASVVWHYEDPVRLAGTDASAASPQRFATASVDASYLFSAEWAASLAYVDQTRFGQPLNTSLGRGVSLGLQRRWAR